MKKQAELAKKVVPKDTEAIKVKWEKKKSQMISEVELKFQKVSKSNRPRGRKNKGQGPTKKKQP